MNILVQLFAALLFGVAVANAQEPRFYDGTVVASREGDAIAVSLSNGHWTQVWRASEAASFELLEGEHEHEHTLAMLFDDDGSLLLASKPVMQEGKLPRIMVRRFAGEAAGDAMVVLGVHAVLAHAGPHAVLVTEQGAWRIPTRGRLVQIAHWNVDSDALSAPSLRETRSGAIDLLLPTYRVTSCEGIDWLGTVDRVLITPDLMVTRKRAPPRLYAGEQSFQRGGDGTVYSTGEIYYSERQVPTTCGLRASTPPGYETRELMRTAMLDGACEMQVSSLGRRAVLALEDKLFSLEQGSATELGVLGADERLLSMAADVEGRALVLLSDGRLLRYSRSEARELLWRAPASWSKRP